MKRREKLQMIAGIALMVSIVVAVTFAIICGTRGNDMGFYISIGYCMLVSLIVLLISGVMLLIMKIKRIKSGGSPLP